jgi:hypothetical protein
MKRTLDQLAEELWLRHMNNGSWRITAELSRVTTAEGKPNPGLAHRIAMKGYSPARSDTRQRLGLPPICVTCHTRLKRVRKVPAWVEEAVENLRRLEVAKSSKGK